MRAKRGLLDGLKNAAAETGRKIGESAKDFQTKRELAREYERLGEIARERSRARAFVSTEIETLVDRVDALETRARDVPVSDDGTEAGGGVRGLRAAAAGAGRKIGENARELQTKRELAEAYEDLGEASYELAKSGAIRDAEIDARVEKIDAIHASLDALVEESKEPSEGDRFRSLRAMFTDDGVHSFSAEGFLVRLVQAVRDEEGGERSSRDVYVSARKRRRTLGLIALGTGPFFAHAANQVADLYCETAVVCEVASLHDLDLTNDDVAAHMLMLWSISNDLPTARGAVRGHPPVADILGAKLLALAGEQFPPDPSTADIAQALWGIRAIAGDMAKGSSKGSLRTVLFTGHRTKKVIRRAERQLGVR